MKILITAQGKEWTSKMDPRFGRAPFLLTFQEESMQLEVTDNQEVQNEAHGAGTATAQKVFNLKPDIIITGNGPGGSATKVLKMWKVKIFTYSGECTIQEAYEKFKQKELNEFVI